jgi:hypothetical protein
MPVEVMVTVTGEMPVTVLPQEDLQLPRALLMVVHLVQTDLPADLLHQHANPEDFLLLPDLLPWNLPAVPAAVAAVMAAGVAVIAEEEAEAAAVSAVAAAVAEVVAEDDKSLDL